MDKPLWTDAIANGALTARIEHIDAAGIVHVHLKGNGVLPARRLTSIGLGDLRVAAASDAPVLCVLENGDPERPIILGIVAPTDTLPEKTDNADAVIDSKRVELTGENEVVLRCGKASITLTKAGKIIVRGTYLLSRSSGVNRIKGGSIQIN